MLKTSGLYSYAKNFLAKITEPINKNSCDFSFKRSISNYQETKVGDFKVIPVQCQRNTNKTNSINLHHVGVTKNGYPYNNPQ